jgi:hypothetical protein
MLARNISRTSGNSRLRRSIREVAPKGTLQLLPRYLPVEVNAVSINATGRCCDVACVRGNDDVVSGTKLVAFGGEVQAAGALCYQYKFVIAEIPRGLDRSSLPRASPHRVNLRGQAFGPERVRSHFRLKNSIFILCRESTPVSYRWSRENKCYHFRSTRKSCLR